MLVIENYKGKNKKEFFVLYLSELNYYFYIFMFKEKCYL